MMAGCSESSDFPSADVVALVRLLADNDIDVVVDGGWGVDALLGKQTRPHADLDIVVRHEDVPRLRALLAARGYKDVPRGDSRDYNFVLGDDKGRLVDVHTYTLVPKGICICGLLVPAESLTGAGTIGGVAVKCISAEWVVKFHTAYEPDENDYRDVMALCRHFGIAVPEKYRR